MVPAKKEVSTVHVVEVMRHKGALMVPEDMSYEDAAKTLAEKAKYDEEKVAITEDIDVFVWDGAIALAKALKDLYGFALQQKTWGFFGPTPPQQIAVETGPGETTKVPWGKFSLPGMEGWVATGVTNNNQGRICFRLQAEVKQKDKEKVNTLAARVRRIATEESVYRGKAFELRLTEHGERLSLPKPRFMLLNNDVVIFNKELEDRIVDNILIPIQYANLVREDGTKLKRGTLLAGPYGTGKTLTAQWIAKVAVQHGWTFIYVTNIEELSEVLQFAQGLFQPVVVFGEDADQVVGEDRNNAMNKLLETLDGLGSKGDEIFTILTTNFPERINAAMRRPGRIDLVLKVDPPDQEAAGRLIRHYAGNRMDKSEDLTKVCEILAGHNPAVIREAVERSKLTVIRRTKSNKQNITESDLIPAAKTIISEQNDFGEPKPELTKDKMLIQGLKGAVRHEVDEALSHRFDD